MKVFCDVQYTEVENDAGRDVDGVVVTCERCGHKAEAYGQGDNSIRRCFVILKEECPRAESNYYLEGNRTGTKGTGSTSRASARRGVPAPAPKQITTGTIPRLIAENKFAVLETETTGLSPEKDQIVQIGIVQIDFGAARWRMQCNVKPTCAISPKAAEIHGLDAVRLYFAPPMAEIANSIVAGISGRVVLGYNCIDFDIPMLDRQLREAGLKGIPDIAVLDVLFLERRYAKDHPEMADAKARTHRLTDAAKRWGVAVDPVREAISNCKTVWGVFVELCSRFPELGQVGLQEAMEIQASERALTGMGLRTGRPGKKTAELTSLF